MQDLAKHYFATLSFGLLGILSLLRSTPLRFTLLCCAALSLALFGYIFTSLDFAILSHALVRYAKPRQTDGIYLTSIALYLPKQAL